MRRGLLHVAQRDPGIEGAVMNACLSVRGVTALPMPARRATLRTTLPAPCRSSRHPAVRCEEYRPPARSLMARSIARAVRASEMVTTLPPLRVIFVLRRGPRAATVASAAGTALELH